jgi:predicted ATPase
MSSLGSSSLELSQELTVESVPMQKAAEILGAPEILRKPNDRLVSWKTEETMSVTTGGGTRASYVPHNEESLQGDGQSTSRRSGQAAQSARHLAKKTQDFTVNRLQFSKAALVGRETEVALLQATLQTHMAGATAASSSDGAPPQEHTRKSHIVLIGGPSGTGKTRLAETLLPTVQSYSHNSSNNSDSNSMGGILVRGKFDLLLRDEPYAGILSAVEDVLDRLLQLQTADKPRFTHIQQALLEALDTDALRLLVHMVPFFHTLVGAHLDAQAAQQATGQAAQPSINMNIDTAQNQFHETFRRFLRVLTRCYTPFVLLLDDLQWADTASLELLEDMVDSTGDADFHLFVIALYRSNEVDATHRLHKAMGHWEDRAAAGKLGLVPISIGNLSQASVHLYLQDLLGENLGGGSSINNKLDGLTHICHAKTQGNIFYLISFLRMAAAHQSLTFQFGLMKWTWDEDKIREHMQSTDNVVALLLERMQTLEHEASRTLLRVAACLGSSFTQATVDLLWAQLVLPRGDDPGDTDVMASVEVCLKEGFLQELDSGKLKWVHDKIHEAALMLTPADERDLFQRQVGESLAEHLSATDLDAVIFVVGQLVSQGPVPSDVQKQEAFSQLNLQAAQRATQLAAFQSALQFAAKGLSFLPHDKWTRFPTLTHDLYMNLIQAERICGEIPSMEVHCREMMESLKDKPIETKLGAYHNLLPGIFNHYPTTRGKEAVDIGFDALQQLGCRFPTGQGTILFKTLAGVLYLKKVRKQLAANGALDVAMMSGHPEKVESAKILYSLIDILYLSKDPRFTLVIIRYIEYTFKYGVTIHAPTVIAFSCALMTGVLNDLKGGALYANFALRLMDMVDYRPIVTGTLMLAHSVGLSWTTPVRDVMKHMVTAYDVGLRTGEREYGAIAAFQEMCYAMQTGRNLDDLETDCRFYLAQLRRDQIHLATGYMEYIYLVILSLKGEDTEELLENIQTSELGAPNAAKPEKERDHFYIYWAHKLLPTYMGDFQQCADMSVTYQDAIKKDFPGSPASMVDPLVRGLSCFVMARKSGKKAYLKEAKRLRLFVKDWVKQGNPNVVHYDALLDAEWDAVRQKKSSNVLAKYERAVSVATRGYFLHDAALFNECWALYALWTLNDKNEATYRLQQAVQLYKDWGAWARVQKMETDYADLLTPELGSS